MENSTISFSFGERSGETDRWPLRLAVAAEFFPRVYETGKPNSRFFRSAVDKSDFKEVMAKAGLRLQFDIKNPLAGQPKEWHIDLTLTDLKSFRPENIAESVPQLKDLLGVRSILSELGQRKLSVADFRERIKAFQLLPELSEGISAALSPPKKAEPKAAKPAPAPPLPKEAPPSGDGSLDSILDMVDIGDERTDTTSEARRKVEAALDEIVGVGKTKGESFNTAAVQNIIPQVDAILSRGVNAVVHHPEFQRVEAVWCGLKFLVDQTDFRKNIRLEIINADKDHFGEVFTSKIYPVEYEAQSETPLAAVIAAYEFEFHTPDMDLLRELAGKAGEIPLVIISSLGASFFGLDNTAKLNELPLLGTHLESPEYVKFNGLRDDPSSRWLVLGYNRFLLRYPYGQEGWRAKTFDFKERTSSEADYLWGNPVWVLASLMARSYARVGWATEIAGRRNGGMIENLPVRPFRLANGEEANIALETPIPDRRLEEFDRAGIIPLLCDVNSDSAYLLAAPSVHRPAHDADPRKAEKKAMEASLPYQMYVGEIARFINRKFAEFTSGVDPAGMESGFARALAAFNIARDEPAKADQVSVQINDSSTQPGRKQLDVSVSSPRRVLHGRAQISMALPLRG